MRLKTILNKLGKHRSFVFGTAKFIGDSEIHVPVTPRVNSKGICSSCGRRGSTYDTAPRPRLFQYIPFVTIRIFFVYRMRRVECPACGVTTERVPWSDSKSPITKAFAWFLAGWAKMLSWKEVSEAFNTSWECVFRAVEMAVEWGLAHRDLTGVEAIGVDEVLWHRGHKYLTVVYEITNGCRRLLWIGRDRKEETIQSFFDWFGERAENLKFVCSDMWKPYLKIIAERAFSAIHVLDRFHIMANISKAIDKVRAEEARRLKEDGYEPVLKSKRWLLLKRPKNLTQKQSSSLKELLEYNLKSVKAYLLKEEFQRLWDYVSPSWAGKFLDHWCRTVAVSRIEPMKKIAKTIKGHRELILNWFRAKGTISAGSVEGINNKLKLTVRKAYGFRTFKATEIALYHAMGDLPKPEDTHRFC